MEQKWEKKTQKKLIFTLTYTCVRVKGILRINEGQYPSA